MHIANLAEVQQITNSLLKIILLGSLHAKDNSQACRFLLVIHVKLLRQIFVLPLAHRNKPKHMPDHIVQIF